MRDQFIKRFAVIFSILVFLSANDARVYLNSDINYRSDDSLFDLEKDFHPNELSKLPSNDVATFEPPEKRFVTVSLLGVAVLSAAFDVYKQEAGCVESHPQIGRNVEWTNEKIEIARAKRDAINLAWNPIYAAEGYFARLGSEMIILRTHIAKIDSLQADIVQLFDQNYFTRVNLVKLQIENDINNFNDTQYGNPDVFLAKFYSTTVFILMLAAKLVPVGIWMGARAWGPQIAKAFAKRLAKSFARGNPGLIARGIRKYQNHRFFPKLRNYWNKKVTLPLRSRFNSLSPKAQGYLKKTGKGLKIFGKSAVVGAFVAYEIYNGWKFFADCSEKLDDSWDARRLVAGSLKNMSIVETEMSNFKNQLYKDYGLLYGNITSDAAMELIDEIYNMTIAAQFQNNTIEQNAMDIKYYRDNIKTAKLGTNKYNFSKVEALTKKLNTAFLKTSFKLDCYRKKMVIIASITRDCASGVGTGDSLWHTAKGLEGTTLVDCIVNQKYLTKVEVLATIKGVMEVLQKSPICLRNSADKQNLVCGDWRSYMTNSKMEEKHKNLTAADITYFVSKCSPANVTSRDVVSICAYKAQKKTLSFIKNEKNRHDQAQVVSAYNNCLLSTDQKTLICAAKQGHKRENIVQADYPGYSDFSATYKACLPDPTKFCLFVRYYGATADSPVFANDTIIYGKPAIEKVVADCAAGDTPEVFQDDHESALDMLSDSVKAESKKKRFIVGAYVREITGTGIASSFDARKICEDYRKYGPHFTMIVHKITEAMFNNIKNIYCPSYGN